jgi:hypothetical protein
MIRKWPKGKFRRRIIKHIWEIFWGVYILEPLEREKPKALPRTSMIKSNFNPKNGKKCEGKHLLQNPGRQRCGHGR